MTLTCTETHTERQINALFSVNAVNIQSTTRLQKEMKKKGKIMKEREEKDTEKMQKRQE